MMSGSDHRDRERKPRPVYRTYHERAADASSILAIKLTPLWSRKMQKTLTKNGRLNLPENGKNDSIFKKLCASGVY